MSDSKMMPSGELGYCVMKAGHEHLRGDDGMHEWRTPQLARGFYRALGDLMARQGAMEAFASYYVAGPDDQPVDEEDKE